MFSVLVWGCNWILFMHGWFCPIHLITTRKQSLWRLCFYRCLSVHRGEVPGPGVVCSWGCLVLGGTWSRGCLVQGVPAPRGVPGPGGAWYASYWNAFLLSNSSNWTKITSFWKKLECLAKVPIVFRDSVLSATDLIWVVFTFCYSMPAVIPAKAKQTLFYGCNVFIHK